MFGGTYKQTHGDLACVCTGVEEGEKVVLEGPSGGVTYGTIYKKGAYKSLQVDSSDIPPPKERKKQTNPEHTLCG